MQGESPPVLVKQSHIQTYSRISVCGRTYLGVVYRKDRIYKKKKKKKNPYVPYPKHTNFFFLVLFGPTKHAKRIEKMVELTYAKLTQGRESTRLPHTHKFTSLKM